ncbi:MAG TPA: PLP-dependent aspartate aminotransferase family protein [Planctomycetota bacterium]|nr:PLP-dependent aspartate aminotransferase family protein [Planctomycetota bacterium]
MHPDTDIQHYGEDRESWWGSVSPPVVRSSLFTFESSRAIEEWFRGERSRFLYTRESNPTTRVLEEKIARLERGEDALAFASGMGAITATLLSHLSSGDHWILQASAYGPTLIFARDVLPRFGVEVTFLGVGELARLRDHIRPTTRLLYLESPSSLSFEMVDLREAGRVARERGIVTVMDNSWATPLYQRPLELGIDLVLHSGTKYIAGHSDIVLGLAAGSAETIARVRRMATLLGATLSPADAALAIRGLRTLPVRMERHARSALEIARRLETHPRVERVLYPALPSDPGHALWRAQLEGASGLFSFVPRGDSRALCDALEIFAIGVSWGGFESLALPVDATRPADPAKDARPDLPRNLVRLSIGLEDVEDLWRDLEKGLEAAAR